MTLSICVFPFLGDGGMVFNATFSNISVIFCWSVLLVEETGVPRENHWPVASHWQTLSRNVVSSTPHLSAFLKKKIKIVSFEMKLIFWNEVCLFKTLTAKLKLQSRLHYMFFKLFFQNDIVCLSCVTSSRDSSTTDRVCLAAEGFGSRMCCLENVSFRVGIEMFTI